MKKKFAWLICLCALTACTAPTSQPTTRPIPVLSAHPPLTSTLQPTHIPPPTLTPTPNCRKAFQPPTPLDPALLHFRAQQAQEFAQSIFQAINGQCPQYFDEFTSEDKLWWLDHKTGLTEVKDGTLYLRTNGATNWISVSNNKMQAKDFVLEFTIRPKVGNNTNASFDVYWRGSRIDGPLFQIYPSREFWTVKNCRGDLCKILGSGETKQLQGDRPIKGTLVAYDAYTAFYINDQPMDILPASGYEINIAFAASTGNKSAEIGIDQIKLWKIKGSIAQGSIARLKHPASLVLPDINNRPDVNRVPPIPGSFGTMPNFNEQDYGEMRMIREGGFSHLRTVLVWSELEISQSKYDFALPDIVFEYAARENMYIHLMPNFNPMWTPGSFPYPQSYFPPTTEPARTVYLNFLRASVQHYSNRGVVWEIPGEPSSTFKTVQSYVDLVREMILVFRENDPTGLIVAPNIHHLNEFGSLSFLKGLGDAGLLCQLDVVGLSAHTVPADAKPESHQVDFLNIRKIVDSYCPDKQVPLAVNEWGYSHADLGAEKQAKYLVRMQLFDLLHDMPFTMQYQWRDGRVGVDIDQSGIVDSSLSPLPAYSALQTLSKTLNGYEFLRRIPVDSSADYVLLFRKEKKAGLTVWTTDSSRTINIPVACPNPKAVDMMGKDYQVEASNTQLTLTISDAPVYILCQDDAPASLIFWKPVRTIQSISQAKPNVLVEISNPSDMAILGEFVLLSTSFADSEVQISLAPRQKTILEIPVPIKEWKANILPVQLNFINADGSVQSSMLWLSIIQGK